MSEAVKLALRVFRRRREQGKKLRDRGTGEPETQEREGTEGAVHAEPRSIPGSGAFRLLYCW